MVKVSVVLPSLNVVSYIDKCLNSVQNQTLKEIEIICVDAGSTDGTAEVIQRYALKDKRIRFYHSEKKSYGYQVNVGMSYAKGEYIAIVDTDDMIRETMYEELYQVAMEQDADFVKANFSEFKELEGIVSIKKEVEIVPKSFCNRILDIAKEVSCFSENITATWSGIYKRTFLEQYQIVHNETAGASYQDTGFWFQTYVFAKRGYFIDKYYYLYRTDNPNSSVVNRGKVYCICDEYDFLKNKLEKEEVQAEVWNIFSYIFYHKYKRNLERVSKEFHLEFLQRFSEDFKTLQEQGYFTMDLWKEEEKEQLLEILQNPENYYEKVLQKRKDFIKELEQQEKIIIYGAGKIGKMLFQELKEIGNVFAFAVTDSSVGIKEYEGVPIKEIQKLSVDEKKTPIVLAVKTENLQKELEQIAGRQGFQNIVKVPLGIFDFD